MILGRGEMKTPVRHRGEILGFLANPLKQKTQIKINFPTNQKSPDSSTASPVQGRVRRYKPLSSADSAYPALQILSRLAVHRSTSRAESTPALLVADFESISTVIEDVLRPG